MKGMDRILKDLNNLSVEARRFIFCLLGLVAFVAILYGRETYHWEVEMKESPKLKLKEVMSAMLDVVERGGMEVVRVRAQADIGERSKGHTREGANDPVTEGDMTSHRLMYYGLKRAFPELVVVSEEREDQDTVVPMPNLNNPDFQVIGEEVAIDRLTVWIDPLDATQEYTEGLTQYVTVMAGLAIDGIPFGGIIHKPFAKEKKTIWSFGDRKNDVMSMLMAMDLVRHEEEDHLKFIVSRSHAGHVKEQVTKYIKPAPVIHAAGGAGYKIWEIISGDHDVYVHTTLMKKWDLCAGAALLRTADGRITDLAGNKIDFKNPFDYKVEDGVVASKYDHLQLVKALKNIIM